MPVLTRKDEGTNARGPGRPRACETASASLVTILNLVRTGQATTRQEIERTGEFGRAVVADRLALLTELGLVDESELGAATGGRAPRLVRFAADNGRVLVATMDQTALGVGIADLSGRLLMEHHEPADLTEPAAAILDRMTSLFDWILSRQSGPGTAPWAVSLSVPAPVAEVGRTFLFETPSILPGWEGALFVETLVRRYGVPVWMRSSVETMTMGELHAGAGIGCTAMLFVKVGKRIGAGLVCDGRLWRGALGAAGLIGQLPVQAGERTGTLDALAGSEMIARQGQVAAEMGRSTLLADLQRRHGSLTAVEVSHAAQMGDQVSIEILSQSGRLIGHVVATLANAFNPEIIVLSGSVAQSNDILLAAVREAVYGASHPLVTRDLRIVRSQMSSSAGLVGAAMVAVEGLFAPPMLKAWILQGHPTAHPAFAALRERLDGLPAAAAAQGAPRDGRV
ncbi:MAG: ROK family protein [Rhodobacteraceae bacterium]|nr:ROK family protein [Paracoccaceae bacterium]